jgi:hypothetical protein
MKRRQINVFSLSFLDCICCGLGAIILLFVIVNSKSPVESNEPNEITPDLRAEVEKLEQQVQNARKNMVQVQNAVKRTVSELSKKEELIKQILALIEEKRLELAQSENQTLANKEHVNKLKADLKSLEQYVKRLEAGNKVAEEDYGSKVRSFAGVGDRQYLTDLKMGGKRIFILVDASASMLDTTIVGAIRRRNLPDRDKLRSLKWKHAVSTVDWLTANMPPSSQFQLYVFNETAHAVIEGTEGRWLSVKQLNKAVADLRKVIPGQGTSLINAFTAMRQMNPGPDNIFLLTDSLPTVGESRPVIGKKVSGKKRVALLNDAIALLPRGVPVNVILYPMEGDPLASSAYWRVATLTQGSFFCPSRDWP